MNDLISRQAAIDAVEKESQIDGAYGYMDTKSIVDLLSDLPSAQPEQRWISCSERLPDEEDIYIVAFDKKCLREDEIQVSDAIWKDNQWQYQMLESFEKRMPRFVIEPIKELKIIAWMPLPPVYQGE